MPWLMLFVGLGSIIVLIYYLLPQPEDNPPIEDWEIDEWVKEERQFSQPREMGFEEYIGQVRHVKRVQAAIKYASDNDEPMKHCAFIGPAGTGKTAMASCVAHELGRKALYTTGQAITSMDVIADIVQQVSGGVLFIDEAHDLALKDGIVTCMLPLLEDWIFSTASGTVSVEPFTCIMATTNWGGLDKAIRSRMGMPYELDPYSDSDMKGIVKSHAQRMGIQVEDGAAEIIGTRSRKNPREASLMLVEARNLASGIIQAKDCHAAFELLQIDRFGLRENDRRLLSMLLNGRCAKSRCAGYLGMDVKTFETTVSMYLFNEGLITIGSRGTEITDKGKLYIGDTS